MAEPIWAHEAPNVSTELIEDLGELVLYVTTGRMFISTRLSEEDAAELAIVLAEWVNSR